MHPLDNKTAQLRVDDIRAFQRELERLQTAGVVEMKADAMDAVREYHSAQIQYLNRKFDIDADSRSRQLSTGMRIASLLGAAALSAGVFFFFHQIWGYLGAALQMLVLSGFSLATLTLTFALERRGASSYFIQLTGILAFVAFVFNIFIPGQIFNLYGSPNAFLLTAVYGFILAYRFSLKWVLAAAIASLTAFIASQMVILAGGPWDSVNMRPENLIPIGVLCFAFPSIIQHKRQPEFPSIYRICGLLLIFLPALVLGFWGEMTYLLVSTEMVEIIYQIVGFSGTLAAVALGVRRQWTDTTHTGMILFALFFYVKLFEWGWDFLPKYLFFFLIGLTALVFLFILKRIRSRVAIPGGGKQ